MTLTIHPAYEQLARKARAAVQAGRSMCDITPTDIELARLYSYAYRGHVIGTFHATRLVLEERSQARAVDLLEDLAQRSMDLIPDDVRVVLSTFYRYDRDVKRVRDLLLQQGAVARIGEHFAAAVGRIMSCNGIYLADDTKVPEQGSFVVPNLGITIVPLVYGDYHSWNVAFLGAAGGDVPRHRHREGVEIHLGYSPIHGETLLGDCRAEVREGYAMPIPPGTDHGYVNHGTQEHHVPFIYGSLKAGGWGVFLDVEPQPTDTEALRPAALDSADMNDSVWLEREIDRTAAETGPARRTILPAERTDRNGCGGLELAVSRATEERCEFPMSSYRIVSVVRGQGVVRLAGIEQAVKPHDHFGIPAGMAASLWQTGVEALVVLDVLLQSPRAAARG